jgi:hypothetical protein
MKKTIDNSPATGDGSDVFDIDLLVLCAEIGLQVCINTSACNIEVECVEDFCFHICFHTLLFAW